MSKSSTFRASAHVMPCSEVPRLLLDGPIRFTTVALDRLFSGEVILQHVVRPQRGWQ